MRIEDWLQNEYPKIKERAKKEQADIDWGDEMGVRSPMCLAEVMALKTTLLSSIKQQKDLAAI